MKPQLTVICRSYNQKPFLAEAIASVFDQEGVIFETILVDDGSTDGSAALALDLSKKYAFDQVFLHDTNLGNTKSFNHALMYANGDYVIDFACDDVFLEGAFKSQVDCLLESPEVGMLYSNAAFINEEGRLTGHEYPIDEKGKAIDKVPSGNVFLDVLKKSFINTPSMVMKRSWLKELGGYNENLVYEDFDIWVRGLQIAPMVYCDKVLVAKRIHDTNSSRNFMSVRGQEYYKSTASIFEDLLSFIQTADQKEALGNRCKYEGRNAGFWGFGEERKRFKKILNGYEFFDSNTKLIWALYRLAGFFLRKRLSKS